jgi:hypothetical protein
MYCTHVNTEYIAARFRAESVKVLYHVYYVLLSLLLHIVFLFPESLMYLL